MELVEALKQYAYDTDNPETNYTLARAYEEIGQTASAITYFMRAAERTTDDNLAYECLLKQALAYDKQGNRNHTVFTMFRHALCLLPKRPEAWFLISRQLERNRSYVDAYTWAHLGLSTADLNAPPLRSSVEYPGEYGIPFEKAVCGWWWGKGNEARKLFSDVAEKYVGKMDDAHTQAVQNNLLFLGSGPDHQSFIGYDNSKHDRLKFKFPGSDKIVQNYSQVYQDLFVLAMLDGKRNGKFLELGSCFPWRGNNTALLETQFDWTGVGIEFNAERAADYSKVRKAKNICADALTVNYDKLLSELAPDGIVDYLQMDLEPPKITFDALLCIPFEKYKFAVITYEHDYYIDISKSYRDKSRRYLTAMGYVLVAANISPNDISAFEDWWVHPDLVSKETIEKFKCVDKNVNKIEDYMLE